MSSTASKYVKGHITILDRSFEGRSTLGDHAFGYSVISAAGIAAEVEIRYWTSGCESSHHHCSAVASISGKQIYSRRSTGFGHRNRPLALAQRTEFAGEAFDLVRAALCESPQDFKVCHNCGEECRPAVRKCPTSWCRSARFAPPTPEQVAKRTQKLDRVLAPLRQATASGPG